jgi:DNA-binding transcriptional LysR family regulator
MNDLQIDYFMAVATNLSFTKTSEELFVSQPAISRQISQLEKELSVRLFIRNNQKTELTEAGRLYYDLFSRYKADLITTRMEVDRILGRKRGVIRVGFLEGWDLFGIIPPMIERFNRDYPDIEVVINCCGVKELTTSLLNGSMDIIVTMNNTVNMNREFVCTDAASISKILIFSANHPLAEESNLTLRNFEKEVFIAPYEIVDDLVIDSISSYTRPFGFIPKLRFVKNHESMITCVRNNMGVAIADTWVWAKGAADLRWIPFNARDIISIARMSARESEPVLVMEKILSDVIYEQESSQK